MSSLVTSPISSGSTALTKALKQVFYIHKDVVADLKAQLDIVTERYKQLKAETEHDRKIKSDKCKSCEHLQEMNQAIQDDFVKQLKKKEAIIQRLKDQLNHHSTGAQNRPKTGELADSSSLKSSPNEEKQSLPTRPLDHEFQAQKNEVSCSKRNSGENKAHSRLQLSKHGKRFSRYVEELPDAKRCRADTSLFIASLEDLAENSCHYKKSVDLDPLVVPETMDVDYYLDENETDNDNEKSSVFSEKSHLNRTCDNDLFNDELETEETLKSTGSESVCTQVEKYEKSNVVDNSAEREVLEDKRNTLKGSLTEKMSSITNAQEKFQGNSKTAQTTPCVQRNLPKDEKVDNPGHQESLLDTTNEPSFFILSKDPSVQSLSHTELSQHCILKQPPQEPKTDSFEGNGDGDGKKKLFKKSAYSSLQSSDVEKTLPKSDAKFRIPPSPVGLASSVSKNRVGLRNKLASCGACLEDKGNDVSTFSRLRASQQSLRSQSWNDSKGGSEEERESSGMNGSLGPGVRLTSYLDSESECFEGTKAGDAGVTTQEDMDDTVAPHQIMSPLKVWPTDALLPGRSVTPGGDGLDRRKSEEEEDVIGPSPRHDSASQVSVSESIPCSSRSFKFMGRPQRQRFLSTPYPVADTTQDPDLEADQTLKAQSQAPYVTVQIVGAAESEAGDDWDEENEDPLESSFKPEVHSSDKMQSLYDSFDRVPQKEEKEYAHVAVVRKKKEREKLLGFSCQECYEYYKHSDLSDEEMQKRIQACSRHRHRFQAPATPEHFWSLGIPDTADISTKDEETQHQAPAPRRRRRLQQRF